MILVTGATGHFGKATIHSLLAKGTAPGQLKALVRNEASAGELKEKGISIVQGDYDDYGSLVNAFRGVDKLLFVSGNDIHKRFTQHQHVVNAAKEAGVKHIVYTSFQRKNETESSPLWVVAASHLQTETWLKESGIAYTILKNNLYMDFLPGFIGEKVLETGTVYVPAGNGKISPVLRAEMAEAAANILAGTGHEGKSYDIVNTEALSYQEIAGIISEISGKQISYISPDPADYAKTLASFHLPEEVIGIFTGFAVAQAQGELDIVGTDIKDILGREPLSVKAFLQTVYKQA